MVVFSFCRIIFKNWEIANLLSDGCASEGKILDKSNKNSLSAIDLDFLAEFKSCASTVSPNTNLVGTNHLHDLFK